MMENQKKPLNIILLGISGSGKGTQAKKLIERFNLKYIGTGELLRNFSQKDNFAARKIRDELKKGNLAPTWFAFYLWLDELVSVPEDQGVIFDGSPRKMQEAEFIDEVLEWYERDNVKVLFIEVSEEEVLRRISKRRVCEGCGKNFIVNDPNEQNLICEECGGKLVVRMEDQDKNAIRRRLEWFKKEVMPVVEHYKKKGNLIVINGEQSIDDVFAEILSKLNYDNN